METRKQYPSGVSVDEWAFVAPYLAPMPVDAPRREHSHRDVFAALRWLVRSGDPWRFLPGDFPPYAAVHQQMQRWLKAGVFEQIAHDLPEMLRLAQGRKAQQSAVVLDGRTMQTALESGPRAGHNGHKRKKGSTVHVAVDTLGELLAVLVPPANEQERAQVVELTRRVQEVTGQRVEVGCVE